MNEPPSPAPSAPTRAELLELYGIAVDEYRFQATFNWSRTQYLLAFNVAILAAGTALLSIPTRTVFSVIVFLVGAVATVLSMRAVSVSHGYYRVTRDRVRRFEDVLGLPADLRFDTTAGFTGRTRVKVNVTQVVYLLMTVLVVADVAGVVVALMSERTP